ncbi:MAG: hypothetical protein ABSG04_05135 [Verrucomicrobiota bacterium]|jgi:hypothetical protein
MNTRKVGAGISRRRFVLSGGAALVLPQLVAGCATAGKPRWQQIPPSSQLTLGFIGMGTQSRGLLENFLR